LQDTGYCNCPPFVPHRYPEIATPFGRIRQTEPSPLCNAELLQLSNGTGGTTLLKAGECRIAARRGASKAAVAVAHSILIIAYSMLKNHQPFQEMGADY